MYRTLILLTLLLASAPAARAGGCVALPGAFDTADGTEELTLLIEDLASLPAQTLVLAGRFHGGGNTAHPALAVSRNGGQSWRFIDLLIPGNGLSHLQTQGETAIWGIVSFRQEGLHKPEYLLRSRDAGQSWCILPLDGLDTREAVESFRFFDRNHGLIVFSDSPFGSGRMVYQTADGGDSWTPVWPTAADSTLIPGSDFTYPGALDPPAHAPLWRLESDRFGIDGLLRVRPEDDWLVFEQYDFRDQAEWRERSRLARIYRLLDGRLRPIP